MSEVFGIGIVGCGNISTTYLDQIPLFKGIEVRACADLNPETARLQAAEYSIEALTVDDMLASDAIDIVVNLTVPAAHFDVSRQILNAGKHVFSEKPFVLSREEGASLLQLASDKKLRIGSAPDTFLGGAHQHARHLIDSGAVGSITSGTAHVMSHGMEHWHPNPDFFFQAGAGPVLDIGPYYVTNLIQLLGSIDKVAALSNTPSPTRTIMSEARQGELIPVETPTTIHALLHFSSGACVTLGTSWDVWQHGHHNMELYGEHGTLHVPDPNFFGGDLSLALGRDPVENLSPINHPFSIPNQDHDLGPMANYRGVGLADMGAAIAQDRPHRCSAELALHAVDVMTTILESGEKHEFVAMNTRCDRPTTLGIEEAWDMLA